VTPFISHGVNNLVVRGSMMGNREVRRHLIWYHTLWPMLFCGSIFLVLFWLVSVFFLQPEAGKLREIGVICFGVIAVVGLMQMLFVLLRPSRST
jgi:hypothetical protein